MTGTLSVTERPCRCSGDPHWLTASCYLPGRVPEASATPFTISVWDLDARLDEARAEGHDEGMEAAEDCPEPHCPIDCNHNECLSPEDAVEIHTVLDALRDVTFTRVSRQAVAEALGVDVNRVGVARSRGVRL